METFFKLSDFLRVHTSKGWLYFNPPSRDLLDHIVDGHFIPQNFVRKQMGIPMKVTSCYRPEEHEKRSGRDGSSQHTFKDHGFSNLFGATDSTPWSERHKTSSNLAKMCENLIKKYNRVCFYPLERFGHSDYKTSPKNKQRFIADYKYDDKRKVWVYSGWVYYENHDEWIEAIKEQFERFHKK